MDFEVLQKQLCLSSGGQVTRAELPMSSLCICIIHWSALHNFLPGCNFQGLLCPGQQYNFISDILSIYCQSGRTESVLTTKHIRQQLWKNHKRALMEIFHWKICIKSINFFEFFFTKMYWRHYIILHCKWRSKFLTYSTVKVMYKAQWKSMPLWQFCNYWCPPSCS